MIQINASYLHLLDRFRSEDTNTDAINCFQIRPAWQGKGIVIEALNGHMYGVFHDPDGICKVAGGILFRPSAAMMKACKPGKVQVGIKKVDACPVLLIETQPYEGSDTWKPRHGLVATAVRLEHGLDADLSGIVLHVEPNPKDCLPDYQFPNTHHFIAKVQQCHGNECPQMHQQAFPTKQLALYDFGDKNYRCIVLHPTGGIESPVFVTVASHPNFLGIIMPMSLDNHGGNAEINREVQNPFKSFLPSMTLTKEQTETQQPEAYTHAEAV